MKKKLLRGETMKKKIISIALSTCVLASVATAGVGCGNNSGEKVDKNRTQVYVNVLNCGIGTEFAYNLKAAYEKKNPKAQIMITTDETLEGEGLQSLKTNTDTDVIFAPNVILQDFVSSKNGTSEYFADITDIITADGENSILAKMQTNQRAYHNIGTDEQPKFYSLPWFVSYFGTVYDVDLFEEKKLYNIEGYAGLDCKGGTADDFFGPDGKENTYDDGLPATWEDMKILLDEMVANNITPFTWTSYKGYIESWMSSIMASYEGADNYSLLTTLDGKYVYSEDTEWLSGGTLNEETGYMELDINRQNGYMLAYQNGKKAALEFAEYIIQNNLYSAKALGTTQNHYEAQTEYLTSVELCKTDSKVQRIAFLAEGNWWENEAKDTFKDMEESYHEKYAYGTRRFGYFPWPKFIGSEDIPDQVHTETTLGGKVSCSSAVCVVNKISKNVDLAKDFVKFAYSDEGNAIFTTSTGVLRPFDYTLTNEQYNSLTYYQRTVYDLTREESTKKANGGTRMGLAYTANEYITGIFGVTGLSPNKSKYLQPFTAFTASSGAGAVRTAEGYMDFVKRYVESNMTLWK